MIQLIHGDCLEKMKDIESGSVDMVLTSPPYNMGLRIRNGKYCKSSCNDINVKYKQFSDDLSMSDYYQFNKNVLNECLRVSDLVFYNVQFLTGNKRALFKLMGEFNEKLKEMICWDKCSAQPAISNGVMNSQFEVLLVFQNSNPESRLFKTAQFDRGTLSNLFKIKRGKKISEDHGAVFPIELAETVIDSFTMQSATVLDPFMGTGTTGVACNNLQRGFIGIEKDDNYFKISENRINQHAAQGRLF